jgi:hypothetical protein
MVDAQEAVDIRIVVPDKFKMPKRKESSEEGTVLRWCQENGVDFVKMQKKKHWPDRFVILPCRQIVWIEMKRKGEKPTKGQREIHAYLRAKGHAVEVCDSAASAIESIQRWLGATLIPKKGDQVRP